MNSANMDKLSKACQRTVEAGKSLIAEMEMSKMPNREKNIKYIGDIVQQLEKDAAAYGKNRNFKE